MNADSKMDIEFGKKNINFDEFIKEFNVPPKKVEEYKELMDARNKTGLFDKNLATLHTMQFECEHRFKRLTNILNDSCSTVSRIMFQLEGKSQTENVEVANKNIVQYIATLGMKLEKMCTYVQSKQKSLVEEPMMEEEYIEMVPNKDGHFLTTKLTKSPNYLHLNPIRVEIDFNEDYLPQDRKTKKMLKNPDVSLHYMTDIENDEYNIEFDGIRQEQKDEEVDDLYQEDTRIEN